jgi:signal peptidase I
LAPDDKPKPRLDRQKLKKEIRGWAITIGAVLAFRIFLFEAVYIPSGSMIPTLFIGDYVIVQKWAYGARLPFTQTAQLSWGSPRRGDIVVLLPPPGRGADDLIKRVVAVAGDTVEIRDGALLVNGVNKRQPKKDDPEADDKCRYDGLNQGGTWTVEPCVGYPEELEGHKYLTYCTPHLPCQDVAKFSVPDGHVWLAGDHRDASADSRVFGPVPIGRIKGRAWLTLASWGPHGPRWDRLFHFVNH